MLIFLQAVLGFDKLLYISLESKRVHPDKQAIARKWGIGLAIALRIILLFVVIEAIDSFQNPFFSPNIDNVITGEFNIHAALVLAGGVFIIYTAMKEIMHMLSIEHLENSLEEKPRSLSAAITMIVIMNIVFSFDSILSALALTEVFAVMAIAILFSGVLMIVLADRVAEFLKKNRMYEVLGLFILFLVGIMLVTEGGHLAHLKLFGHEIHAMEKSTFYFVLGILVLVDVAQGKYQKKLDMERRREQSRPTAS